MPKLPVIPVQKYQLTEGTVFRFVRTKSTDRRVFYISPKAMLQPKLVGGEIPVEAMNGRDDWFVEILWKPKPVRF